MDKKNFWFTNSKNLFTEQSFELVTQAMLSKNKTKQSKKELTESVTWKSN